MALIACPDCGTSVSDLAVACPKCARPIVTRGKVVVLGGQPPGGAKTRAPAVKPSPLLAFLITRKVEPDIAFGTLAASVVVLVFGYQLVTGTGLFGAAPVMTRSAPASRPALPARPAISEETRELAWTERGKDMVRTKLKDPDAAQFDGVRFHRGQDNVPITCGRVNAKNSFGAYGGFQRFVSAGREDLTFLEEQVQGGFSEIWTRFCG